MRKFKSIVINSILKLYDANLNYSDISQANDNSYIDAEFDDNIDELYSENYIYGTLKQGNRIDICNIHTQKYDDRGKVESFYGLFVQVEIDKFIQDTIKIKKESIYSAYNVYTKNKIAEKHFLKYGIELLVELSPEITIKGNKLYARMETRKFFEFENIFNRKSNYDDAQNYYETIGYVLELTRIFVERINTLEV